MYVGSALAWPPLLVRGGLSGAVISSVPVAVLGSLLAGREALAGWSLAMIVVCAYFVGSVVGDALATLRMDGGGMVVMLAGFCLRAGLVAFVLWQLSAHQILMGPARTRWFGWTTLGLVIGWIAGVVFTARNTRSLIVEEPLSTGEGPR